jgi:hypothetical protein
LWGLKEATAPEIEKPGDFIAEQLIYEAVAPGRDFEESGVERGLLAIVGMQVKFCSRKIPMGKDVLARKQKS